jgi:hypothetical protein
MAIFKTTVDKSISIVLIYTSTFGATNTTVASKSVILPICPVDLTDKVSFPVSFATKVRQLINSLLCCRIHTWPPTFFLLFCCPLLEALQHQTVSFYSNKQQEFL